MEDHLSSGRHHIVHDAEVVPHLRVRVQVRVRVRVNILFFQVSDLVRFWCD